ncbi:MAG: hypothetical protein D6776_11920 [Planctomycetota bacterium]|nr:MAG: hypothetical protein D6776_11920 [Planctomycetota bacterium]
MRTSRCFVAVLFAAALGAVQPAVAQEHATLALEIVAQDGAAAVDAWALVDPDPLARELGVRAGVYAPPVAAVRATEGRCTLRLAPGRHTIAVGALGCETRRRQLTLAAGASARLRVSLRRRGVATVRVHVLDRAGRALPVSATARCRVAIEPAAGGDAIERALGEAGEDAPGLFALAPGDYLFELREPLPGAVPVPLHVEDGDARELGLQIGHGAVLEAQVLDDEGNPVSEPVRYRVVRLEPRDDPEEVARRAELLGPDAPRTDEDGVLRAGPLPSGRYVVLARQPGRARGASPVLRLPRRAGAEPVSFELDRRDYGEAELTLRLRGPDGVSVAQHPVQITLAIRGFEPPVRLLRESSAEGRLVLPGLPAERAIALELRVLDRVGGRAVAVGGLRLVVDEGTERVRRRIVLRAPIAVVGTVVGFARRPVGPGTLRWAPVELDGTRPERLETLHFGKDGRFVLPEVDPARKLYLEVDAERHRPFRATLEPAAELEVPVSPR